MVLLLPDILVTCKPTELVRFAQVPSHAALLLATLKKPLRGVQMVDVLIRSLLSPTEYKATFIRSAMV